MNTKHLKHQLQTIIDEKPNTLEAYVANEALEHEDITAFFSDLQQHGCVSGMISSLIYYSDTHAFYDQFYDEIEELRSDYEDNIGKPLKVQGDLKNFFAWFAFEETAYQLTVELQLD